MRNPFRYFNSSPEVIRLAVLSDHNKLAPRARPSFLTTRDDIGWEAVTLKGELAHRASLISISLSGQPSLCDNACASLVALASGEKSTGAAADAKPLRSPVMPGKRIRPVDNKLN